MSNFTDYYLDDATGNIIAIYRQSGDTLKLIEKPIYGSSRLGVVMNWICILLLLILSSCQKKRNIIEQSKDPLVIGYIDSLIVNRDINILSMGGVSINLYLYLSLHDDRKLYFPLRSFHNTQDGYIPYMWYISKKDTFEMVSMRSSESNESNDTVSLSIDFPNVFITRIVYPSINIYSIKELQNQQYELFFGSGDYVIINDLLNKEMIYFIKSPNFHISYIIDNCRVMSLDSLQLNFKLEPPNKE